MELDQHYKQMMLRLALMKMTVQEMRQACQAQIGKCPPSSLRKHEQVQWIVSVLVPDGEDG